MQNPILHFSFSILHSHDYADPVFVAKSGKTNEVVILIGKTYTISSEWPFAVVGASDPETEIWQMRSAEHQTHVRRPVTILSSEGNPFTMSVLPTNLGGTFVWNQPDCGCTLTGSGDTFSWNCPMTCTCCGTYADGWYSYEGYLLPAVGCLCGCWSDGTPEWSHSPTPLAASVSASFSKSAVIFENSYTNKPGEVVGRRSTRTRLNIVANGGPNGAALTVTHANIAKLLHVSGPSLPLASVDVPPETSVRYSIVYEGLVQSDVVNDILVTTVLLDVATNETLTNECQLTSVGVELTASKPALDNPDTHRHIFGVFEEFAYAHHPQDILAQWSFWEGEDEILPFEEGRVILPPTISSAARGSCVFHVAVGDNSYTNSFRFVLPTISVRNARCNEQIQTVMGEAGWVVLHFDQFVEPYYVSFEGLEMVEIPDESGNCPHAGYFNDVTKGGPLSHTEAVGAGVFIPVDSNGQWGSDRCGRAGRYEEPISSGWKEWPIPVGWGFEPTVHGRFSSPPTTQRFALTSDGTFSIRKYKYEATRSPTGTPIIQEIEP